MPAPVRRAMLETIETQRFGCEMAGSPLYAALLEEVAAQVAVGGPVAELLEPVAEAPFGDAVLLRLLAALHLLVLEGQAPELAAHFPSAGGAPGPGLGPALAATVSAHRDALASGVARGVQTNEVGRSASLLGGFLEAARSGFPLRVLELGASGGLNLLFDRYRYEDATGSFGPPDSPLRFDHPWFGGAPDLAIPLEVAERRGCDLDPLDVTSAEGRARLRSFIWPDQLDRLARLDAALEVAQADPPAVDRADAADWLAEQLAVAAPGRTTVVVHSIVLQYLPPATRRRVLALIDQAGTRATADAPVVWLRLEPGGDQAELRVTAWPGGQTHVVATSAYHGPPVVWLAPRHGVVRPAPTPG